MQSNKATEASRKPGTGLKSAVSAGRKGPFSPGPNTASAEHTAIPGEILRIWAANVPHPE